MRRGLGLAACAAALLVASGCTPAPSISISLATSQLTLIRGDTQDVIVTLQRGGAATAPVDLVVSGAPAGVTANLAPATLTGAASTATLTVAADASAAPASVTLTVAAASGGLADSVTLRLDVRSLTVHGRVVAYIHQPVPNVTVKIQGNTAVTAADGTFTIAGLTVPYTAVLLSSFDNWAHAFEGLRTATPVFAPYLPSAAIPSPAPTDLATLAGTLSPAVPIDAGHPVVVCVEGSVIVVYGCTTVNSGNAYALNASWPHGVDPGARVHALQTLLDASGLPTGYDYAVSDEVTLHHGDSLTVDLAPTSTATADVTGAVSMPPGYALAGIGAFVELADHLTMRLPVAAASVPASYDLVVPDLAGGSYQLFALGGHSSALSYRWRANLTAGTADLDLPAAAQPTSPADGATGVTTLTAFTASWGGGALTYVLEPAAATDPTFAITTTSTSVTLHDMVSAAGLGFPAVATYDWSVRGTPGITDMDVAAEHWLADAYTFVAVTNTGGPGWSVDGGLTLSPSRSFVTY